MSLYGALDEVDSRRDCLETQHVSTVKRSIPIPSALAVLPSTPLPSIALAVLSISVMSEFLCANVSTPFLFAMVRSFSLADDEVLIGYWTGILVSVFFIAQFATSLIWASLVNVLGRRAVLFISLLGSAVTCILFSVQTNLTSAVVLRLAQGIFSGAVGVARSGVILITDSSNEGRAYAIMGCAWGLGGVIGAVIGGTFESPSEKWPLLFDDIALLKHYPYLLPCMMAATVTLTGATLCIFLTRDGLPRHWSLPHEQIAIHPDSTHPAIGFPRLDSYTSYVSQISHLPMHNAPVVVFASSQQQPSEDFNAKPHASRNLATVCNVGEIPDNHGSQENIVERIITANESRATSLPDLWAAAAMNTDVTCSEDLIDHFSNPEDCTGERQDQSPPIPSREHLPLLRYNSITTLDGRQAVIAHSTSLRMYRTLTTSSFAISHGSVTRRAPSIFANMGLHSTRSFDAFSVNDNVIYEDDASVYDAHDDRERILQRVPLLFILQYGLLALHTTTHDQVFYSYLMTKFEAGGLGLFPSQFSQLIASMSVAQLFYQFYLYPTLGPPRGSLSHLTMFRLGCLFFIPSYFTVVFYRGWQQPILMLGLIASTAVRYCATTFAFTSASILINFLTPPPYVGLANGLAQSMASLARFVGPALGAKLWAVSVSVDPEGYAIGFWVCTAVCTLQQYIT